VGVLNVNDKVEPPDVFDDTDAACLTIAAEHLACAIAMRQEASDLAETQLREAEAALAARAADLAAAAGEAVDASRVATQP